MVDDVVINKAATIERAVARAREEYDGNRDNLVANETRQDAIVLNLQRACEASIDLAMYLVARERSGAPQTSREAFDILVQGAVLPGLDAALALSLKRMVGFRNIAVHDYQRLSLDVVQAILEHGVDDLLRFARFALARASLVRNEET